MIIITSTASLIAAVIYTLLASYGGYELTGKVISYITNKRKTIKLNKVMKGSVDTDTSGNVIYKE